MENDKELKQAKKRTEKDLYYGYCNTKSAIYTI